MQQKTLKEALQEKIPKKFHRILPRSFDALGNLAIIEIPKQLRPYEKIIGATLLTLHKHIQTVCRKQGGHTGKLRIQQHKIIAGKRTKEVLYKENHAQFILHIDKTYFSARLAQERLRIAKLIKPGETILVMFSGVAPYPIVFAKNSKAKRIVGVELNKKAHQYALQNVALNKVSNVVLYQGDAQKIVPKLKEKFDRIVMPLPRGAEDYLGVALQKIKKKGCIHFYYFVNEDKLHEAATTMQEACKKKKKQCKILSITKCGQQAPGIYRVCVDADISY